MTNTHTHIGTTRNGEQVTVRPAGTGWRVWIDDTRIGDRFADKAEAVRDAEYYVPATPEHSVFVAERALLAR